MGASLGSCIDEIAARGYHYRLRTVGNGQVKLDASTEVKVTADWKPTFSVTGDALLVGTLTEIWLRS